jgi:Mn-dependent DtxR family transcriptional regulator
MKSSSRKNDHQWRFVTNHGRVLECIATDSTARLRDIAELVGITERAVAQIVNDLEADGYISKQRAGRRNEYEIHPDRPLRHPRHQHRTAHELISFLRKPGSP